MQFEACFLYDWHEYISCKLNPSFLFVKILKTTSMINILTSKESQIKINKSAGGQQNAQTSCCTVQKGQVVRLARSVDTLRASWFFNSQDVHNTTAKKAVATLRIS